MKDPRCIEEFLILRKDALSTSEVTDAVAVEEPLEISLRFSTTSGMMRKNISVTMRTPGDDEALAAGFLFTEQVIKTADIEQFQASAENAITVELKQGIAPDLKSIERNFYSSSSCGVCGKSSIDSVKLELPYFHEAPDLLFKSSILRQLPGLLRAQQRLFTRTGGIHACAIFDKAAKCISCKEDVGRHNALDKLIGEAMLRGELPLSNVTLVLSGRASFELVQKAAMAGIQIIAAVGAPSSLAVETAREFNCTLIGFLKPESMNIYSGFERIIEL